MSKSQKMLEALECQDLEKAEILFEEALEQDSEEILLELAGYLETIGFLPQAQQIYEKLLPHYPELAINLAEIAMEDGQAEQAFAYLDSIEEDSPCYLQALVSQADFYQLEGLTDVARQKLLQAQALSDDPLICFGLAEIELELGHYREAIQLYASLDNTAIYEQTGVSTYQRIGLAYAYLGKLEAAIEFLEKAVQLDYDDQTLFELAALYFELENYQRASLCFKQLETLNPDFEGHHFLYAQSLHAEHETEQALTVLQQALGQNEMDSQLLLLASQYAYELGKSQMAEDFLLRAREWAEDLEEVDLRLSSLYMEEERYEELLELEREDLDNVLTRWQIAKAYQALEDDRALEKYAELVEDLAENPEFLKDYSLLLRVFGRLEQSRELMKDYLKLVPDDAEMAQLCQDLEED